MMDRSLWHEVEGDWRLVYGSFLKDSRSIEWHEFRVDEVFDWARSFHPDCLEICLNFGGSARLFEGEKEVNLVAGQAAMYSTVVGEAGGLGAERSSGEMHRFFTIELGVEYLRERVQYVLDSLRPEVRVFCESGKPPASLLHVEQMPPQLLALRMQLLEPPVNPAAHTLWYESKITEILSYFVFLPEAPTELFCERHRRVNRERCERVLFLLERDMENPPSLEMLADEVGCSPFYLSRLFAQQTGASIPGTLRQLRMCEAAKLLREKSMSVTDVAMRVGYSSLGAFNKAFLHHHGCSPTKLRRKRI